MGHSLFSNFGCSLVKRFQERLDFVCFFQVDSKSVLVHSQLGQITHIVDDKLALYSSRRELFQLKKFYKRTYLYTLQYTHALAHARTPALLA